MSSNGASISRPTTPWQEPPPMLDSLSRPRRRFAALLVLLGLALPIVGGAAPSPEWRQRSLEARMLAPAEGERAVESAIRLAFELPKGAREPRLIVSRPAFDPLGWAAIESRSQ